MSGSVISELGKEVPKELLHEPISVFDLMIFRFKEKPWDPAKPLIR